MLFPFLDPVLGSRRGVTNMKVEAVPSSRRDLLVGVVAAIGAAGTSGFPRELYADTTVTVEQFLALSQRLTNASGLDAAVAKTLLGGFLAIGNGAALAALIAGQRQDGPLANAIVAAWYSGIYDGGTGKQAVATFTDALLWNALTFTKPPGWCGGQTGYWAQAPGT
jgi:hypothetical protein